jgi:hypothetical protein
MDRVFPHVQAPEGTLSSAGNVGNAMTNSHSGVRTDKKGREPTSTVAGESPCL